MILCSLFLFAILELYGTVFRSELRVYIVLINFLIERPDGKFLKRISIAFGVLLAMGQALSFPLSIYGSARVGYYGS